MADVNQQAQELAEAIEKLNKAMGISTSGFSRASEQMQDAAMKAKYGINNFTKGTESAAESITSMAKAGTEGAKAMLEGKKGAAAFNSAIDEMSNAAKSAGAALAAMIPGGPVIKLLIAGITAAATATAEYVKKSNEMADKLYSGYSKLAKSGAAASGGMTGVFEGAKKLGLSMDQLDGYVGLVSENSKDLALFAGSVFEGRKRFEDMGAAMEPYRKGLLAAGYTQEQINEGAMGYLKLQTRVGAAQRMTTDQLAEGARKYLIEQDALAKVTGQSRKEMEDQRERALQQQQFAAKIRELEKAGKDKEVAELMKLNSMYAAMGPKMASAFQASVTGNLANADAVDANIASNMEMMRTADLVSKGQMTAAEAAQTTGKAIGKFNDDINISLGGVNAAIGDFAEFEKARQMTEGNIVENMKKAEEERRKQGMEGGKAADKLTEQYAKNLKQQQEINEKMERVYFKGIDNALSITNKLGNVTNTLADQFLKLSDALNKVLNFFGLGTKEPAKPEPKTVAEAKAVEATGKERELAKPLQDRVDTLAKTLEADEKALKDAKRAGKYGDELKPLEEKIKENKVKYEKASQELLEQEKKIAAAAQEERKIRQQQKLDQSELARLENMNVSEVEKLAKLNEERANLAAKGVSTAKVEQQIKDTRASIDQRASKMAELKERLAPAAPAAAGAAPAAPGGKPVKTGEGDLSGLTIKEGDVHQQGSAVSPKIIDMARKVQSNMPNFAYFSGFNDKFHQEKAPSSSHTKGTAMDFVLSKTPTKEEGQEIVKYLKSLGADLAIDEYNNPSSNATAGHIHAQINAYADGGIANNPQIAFVAEKGPEAMIPLKDGAIPIQMMGEIGSPKDLILSIENTQHQMLDALQDAMSTGSTTVRPELPEGLESPASIRDLTGILQENSNRTGELVGLLNELLRAQKEQNSISGRLLQVAAN